MWLQLDLDLLNQPRWLNLSLAARAWYESLLARCIETGSGTLRLSEWISTRAMRAKLGLLPDEYPDATARGLLDELASTITHLIDIDEDEDEIFVHGFDRRYAAICEKRQKDAERQRARRERLKRERGGDVTGVSRGRPRDSHDVTKCPRVDPDGDPDPDPIGEKQSDPISDTQSQAVEFGLEYVGVEALGIILPWISGNGGGFNGFGQWDKLRHKIKELDMTDPKHLVASLIDVDKANVKCRFKTLYSRFFPKKGSKRILPSNKAMREAGRRIDARIKAEAKEKA
jgi:hypothetical protein